jgi:hypothetical protein
MSYSSEEWRVNQRIKQLKNRQDVFKPVGIFLLGMGVFADSVDVWPMNVILFAIAIFCFWSCYAITSDIESIVRTCESIDCAKDSKTKEMWKSHLNFLLEGK